MDEKKSFLDKLDEKVYARGKSSWQDVRTKLKNEKISIFSSRKESIDSPKIERVNNLRPELYIEPAKKTFSLFSISFLIIALILFLGSLVYAWYSLSFGTLLVKEKDLVLDISIPIVVNSGQNVSGEVSLINNNRGSIEESYIIIYSKNNQNQKQELLQSDVGTLSRGEKSIKNISFIPVGKEGEKQNIEVTLFYKIEGSTNVFQKIITKEITIQKSEAIINITGPKNISIGQVAEYVVSVRASVDIPTDVGVKIDLPRDQEIIESSMTPISRGVYNFGILKEGQQKIIQIKTIFKDRVELGDKADLRASAGPLENETVKNIFTETSLTLNLKKIPFELTISSNEQKGVNIYFADQKPKVKIVVKNVSKENMTNGRLDIKLSGGVLDPFTVKVNGAEYDAGQKRIYATAETNKNLKEILPNTEVVFEIEFDGVKNTNITDSRKIMLDTSFQTDIPDSSASPATMKKMTNLLPKDNTLAGLKTLYFSGAFKNEGSMPPRVGVKNTYTLAMSVETYGGFKNGLYTVILPSYVEFIETDSQEVSYNKNRREIIWNVKDVNQNVDEEFVQLTKREASVKVAIIPTPSQFKQSPQLTSGGNFSAIAVDGGVINSKIKDVTIDFPKDLVYVASRGYGTVGE